MASNSVRSKYFVGDWEGCCVAASKSPSSSENKSLLFRSLVHLGRSADAKKLIKTDSALDASLLIYADAYGSKSVKSDMQRFIRAAEQAGNQEAERDEAAVILSTIYHWAGQAEEAYRLAALSPALEAQLLLITFLCNINRLDLAERKLEKLKRSNVDEVPFQLAEAEVAIAKGDVHIKDALYIYQELAELYGRTKKLLAAQTCALLLLERLGEAEDLVLNILQMDPHNSIALSHLVSLSVMRGAGAHMINDQLARLAASDKKAPLLSRLEELAVSFESAQL